MLEIRLLGEVEVVRDGARLTLPPSKRTRGLLAYLAATGRRHRRDRLCAMLWEVPDDPRGALRWSLTKLRALVDESERKRIVADRETVGFEPEGAEIDVVALRQRLRAGPESLPSEALADAARAFRGDFLENLDLPSCPEFQAWCVAERQEFKALHARVLKRLAAQLDPEEALPHARALANLDPHDEASRATLVRLLGASGRREEAEQQYELARRALAELGPSTTGELERARRELRGLGLGPRPGEISTKAAASPAPSVAAGGDVPPARPAEATERPSSAGEKLATSAERKEISILVAAVARPADPGADSDPESVMEALDSALEEMKDAVRRHEGTVSAARSDGLTALFGAPIAHEDHTIRACQAALAMQAALRERAPGVLDLRIGVHAGEVVVRSSSADGPLEAVGPVATLAAQIAGAAEPGAILMSGEAARRAEGFVQVQPLKPRSGLAAELPRDLLVLRGMTAVRTRWEVRAVRGLTPFVGREAEMDALARATRRVAAGHGEVVAVVADPGIGKSRLIHEFVRTVVPAGWSVLETGAASHDGKAIYRPISRLLRSWFGVEEQDDKPQIEAKVRGKVDEFCPELKPTLPALLSLLDLSVSDPEWLALGPPQRRRRTLEAVKAVLARESRERPLALLFEDLHWIDGETQAALDTLVASLGALRLLLVATHRPEYRHDWAGRSYFSQLRLQPLASAAAERLLTSLIGDDPSLGELRREVVVRTEGTPLFVEETVRALAEAGALAGRAGRYRLGRPVATLEIPSTIHAVIAARIDRLPAAGKQLLQVASIIGRDVPLALLTEVAGLPESALEEALAGLQAAEFLYETRLFPDAEYSFKHAFTQEVAYGSVLRERRRAIHVEIVRTIEALTGDRLDEQVERLAYHTVKGHLWEPGIRYLFRAAGRSIQRSAHQQAIAFLGQGIELIPKLADERVRLQTELDFQKALGTALMAAKGWGAQEVADAYLRARALAEALGDERELFAVLRGQGQFHMIRGEGEIAREFGNRCVDLARASGDQAQRIEAHHLFWSNSFFMGDYGGAGHHAERGIALYERARDHRLTYMYSGHDPGVCCRCFAGLAQWQLGDAGGALARCREALALAQEVAHPLTIALAHWALSYVHIFRREPAEARRAAEAEIAVCEEYLLPLVLSQGRFQLGWALAEQGELGKGIELMRQGLDSIRATGAEMGLPYLAALLGEALAKSGRVDEGLAEIAGALSDIERHGTRFHLPEVQRLHGEVLAMRPERDMERALACFRDAMATAQAQRAPLLELRAAASLARATRDRRHATEARRTLAELCRRLDGTPESVDLHEARLLMAG